MYRTTRTSDRLIPATGRRHRTERTHTHHILYLLSRKGDRGRLPPPGTSAAPVDDTGSGTAHTPHILYILSRDRESTATPSIWCIGGTGRRHRHRHTPHPSYTVYTIAERGSRPTPSPCGASAELRPPVGDTGSDTAHTAHILYILSRKGDRRRLPPHVVHRQN